MRALQRLCLLGVVPLGLACAAIACDAGGLTELVVRPGEPGDGGDLADALASDGALGDGSDDLDGGDAATTPTFIGLTPTPAGDGPPSAADVIAARLVSLASGARAVVTRRTPEELSSSAAVDALAAEADFFQQRGTTMSFTLAVVDGATAHLPPEVSAFSWNAPEVAASTRATIDAALTSLDGSASFFVLGRDVDVYLEAHPAERAAFELFVIDTLDYVHAHPLAPEGLRAGVGFSFQGVSKPDPSYLPILDTADIAVSSYLPGLGDVEGGPLGAIAADADMLVLRAAGKPIMLESVGAPTSSVVGGSESKQAIFLDTFFDVIAARRDGFVFVNVDALHDLGPVRCEARAALLGVPPDGLWAAYLCSLGLFTPDDQEKAAWTSFVKGAARFASP